MNPRTCRNLALLLALGACGTPAVAPEAVRAERERLLRPFQDSLAVVADEVHFELSRNFNEKLTRPVGGTAGEATRTEEDGDVVFTWVTAGGVHLPLRFEIEGVQFAALKSASLRIRGSGKPFALEALARGAVGLSRGGATEDYSEVRIADGMLHQR